MSSMDIVIKLLEKIVSTSKKEVESNQGIVNELKRDNIAVTVNLDTSITSLTPIKLDSVIGGQVRSITVLDVGGGLYLQTSISDPFTVLVGDSIKDEEIEVLRWKGAGAGTAILRITGVRL